MLWQMSCSECFLSLVIGVGSGGLACGVLWGEVDAEVLTAGPGRLGWGDCAIVFANNTCALIHSACVTSVIFTCCDV